MEEQLEQRKAHDNTYRPVITEERQSVDQFLITEAGVTAHNGGYQGDQGALKQANMDKVHELEDEITES